MLIDTLKALKAEREDTETLVANSALASLIRTEFEKTNSEVPAWLDEVSRNLKREINARNADAIENKKAQLRASIDRLKSRDEKRAELEQKLAALNQ